ncbi:NAD(P)-binding protein [Hesseltinella vesiculosa]|uniref:NAD(P)-binding protein n=1 Tax=Hesseltinella vesiculosa TaxID=101127 RepID=A0A1X2GCU2_9FUNG|nr:NAD(P)-binding protein [Hesseltinella vesiculosa]
MGFNVLVTGANRGIGLGLVKQFARQSSVSKVFAGVRTPSSFPHIEEEYGKKIHVVQLEVADDASVAASVQTVKKELGSEGLDILVNNAGINGNPKIDPEAIDPDHFLKVLNVNVVGAHRMTAAYMPLLRLAPTKKVINISSTLGSIANHGGFGVYMADYNSSKAALNSMTNLYSLRYKDEGFIFIPMCPGYVKTDLSPDGAISVELSASNVVDLTLKATSENSGVLYSTSYNNQVLEW